MNSESARQRVVAVGQFPPPISGLSYITERCVSALGRQHDVSTHDIAANRAWTSGLRHFSRTGRSLAACLALLGALRAECKICYVACEGGSGLVYTALIVATARLCGYKILLHHHSFQYIDRPKSLMWVILLLGGNITHVFLCCLMRDRFQESYNRKVLATILSNAAFVPVSTAFAQYQQADGEIVLGHLSNLTREKGLYTFFALLRRLRSEGRAFRAILAGPAAPQDLSAIEAALVDLHPHLDYRGPLYGTEKDCFYRDVDVFVFPTQYKNEAQPTVLFEAAAAGCLLVSYDRGCISCQVDGFGICIRKDEDFVARTVAWLHTASPSMGRGERQNLYEKYHQNALEVLNNLL